MTRQLHGSDENPCQKQSQYPVHHAPVRRRSAPSSPGHRSESASLNTSGLSADRRVGVTALRALLEGGESDVASIVGDRASDNLGLRGDRGLIDNGAVLPKV